MRHYIGLPVITFLLLPLLLSECVTSAYGQDTSAASAPQASESSAPLPTLQIGDQAPQLEVDQWFQGQPVTEYSRQHIYVVEFWATWCGPCLKAMPHLDTLASKHAKDGLIVIAFTTADPGNTSEVVRKFVQEKGSKYNFRFAFSNDQKSYRDFMEASGQRGIPCSFVIDRQGRIAFIGQPRDLDYVLDRMVKGQWRGREDAEELQKMNDSIPSVVQIAQTDPGKALEIIRHIREVNPERTKSVDFAYAEVVVLTSAKMFDEARAAIESTMDADSRKNDWGQVALVCAPLASPRSNPDGVHRDFALQTIAEAEQHLQDDWQNLLQVGIAYQMAGDRQKFEGCLNRVTEICPDPNIKNSLQMLRNSPVSSELPAGGSEQ